MLRGMSTNQREMRRRERLWHTEVEALRAVTAEVDEAQTLLLGLDALRAHDHVERVRHVDGGRDDRVVGGAAAEALDEHAVDLELVEREPPEVRERRSAGAEVVDGELHPHVLERAQRSRDRVEVVE